MKISTFNIAGIKARHDTLVAWLKIANPDIVCLQEVKSVDENFPRSDIESLGYHIETHGQKSFNGVAILSKMRPDEVLRRLPGDDNDQQARYIEAVFTYKHSVLRIASLYLPNGNPVDSVKYPYKLQWLERLYVHAKNLLSLEEPLILAGDYNIIPAPIDAKNPKQWQNDALFLPKSRQAFQKIVNLGLYDAIRCVSDAPNYTFWDFQKGAWQKDNGIRIDHFLLSSQAIDIMKTAYVERDIRGIEKPSDHTVVTLELKS